MTEKKKKPLSKSDMAKKMLEFFGPDGKKWSNKTGVKGKCCILEVTYELFGLDDQIIEKEICERLKMDTVAVGKWQDLQEWPTIKRLLNSIRDRRKFDMKPKKAAQESSARA